MYIYDLYKDDQRHLIQDGYVALNYTIKLLSNTIKFGKYIAFCFILSI